jgi:hypothetical protein
MFFFSNLEPPSYFTAVLLDYLILVWMSGPLVPWSVLSLSNTLAQSSEVITVGPLFTICPYPLFLRKTSAPE